ncbi:penicillin-binding protein [Clostridium polyendosporum]|uniref:Penicillin-binding protein n=1 Tax=Clostridium polyendosporum TaxID=69208 RepID=A0A919RZN5_9CLOT|nr:penicillin-binding transpeptidase domain-containing protein [Clostridium polyendosporum]GIM27908.1 penicillin-binding protein [Clostridium polyendosporum]
MNFNSRRVNIIRIMLIFLLVGLFGRLFYLQNKYNPKAVNTSFKNNTQQDSISQTKYLLLDENGKDLLNYNKRYVVVIDVMSFKLNSAENNLKNLLAFNFIMKSEKSDFSFKDLLSKNGKVYFSVSEENYNKIQQLKGMKGMYMFIFDEVNKSEAWKIETMLISPYKNNTQDKSDKKELKDSGTLEKTIFDYTNNNVTPNVMYRIQNDSTYQLQGYNIPNSNINVKLTLNKDWQDTIRNILKNEKYKSFQNVGVVIIEADSGKVRALVQKDETQPNIALGVTNYCFDPGSTFKIIAEAAAIEENFDEKELFYCNGQYCSHAHGYVNIHDAFKLSCNEVFRKIGIELGYDKLIGLAKKQGLFTKNLGLQDESPGVLPEEDNNIVNIAIGQTFLVSPLQMSAVVATVLNNGGYIKPYIIDEFVDNSGKIIKKFSSNETQVIKSSTAAKIKEDMREVVLDGTGTNGKIEGIETGGKTGTAEAPQNNKENYHGWFAGYFNMNGKYYSLVVFVPNMREFDSEQGKSGNTAAAPIFKDIVVNLLKTN